MKMCIVNQLLKKFLLWFIYQLWLSDVKYLSIELNFFIICVFFIFCSLRHGAPLMSFNGWNKRGSINLFSFFNVRLWLYDIKISEWNHTYIKICYILINIFYFTWLLYMYIPVFYGISGHHVTGSDLAQLKLSFLGL